MINTIKKYLKDEKGFTLIELIVVIAIIGILIAVAVPKMSGFTTMAKESNDKQLAKMIGNNVSILLASEKISGSGKITVSYASNALVYTVTGIAIKGVTGDAAAVNTGMATEMGKLLDTGSKITTTDATIVVDVSAAGDVTSVYTPPAA